MTDPVLPVGLEALPAKWRKEASDLYNNGKGRDQRIKDLLQARAEEKADAADELEAVLSTEPSEKFTFVCNTCKERHTMLLPELGK